MRKLFASVALLALLSVSLSGCAGFAEAMAAAGAQQQQNEPVDDYEWLDNRQRDTSATGIR